MDEKEFKFKKDILENEYTTGNISHKEYMTRLIQLGQTGKLIRGERDQRSIWAKENEGIN